MNSKENSVEVKGLWIAEQGGIRELSTRLVQKISGQIGQ